MTTQISARGRLTTVVVLAAGLCLLASVSGCDVGRAETPAYYHRVSAQLLQQQPAYTVERLFAGRVTARQRVALGFELAGSVAEVWVDEGDEVAKGQLLAKLDSRLLLARRRQTEASQAELAAQLTLARLELKRQQSLSQQGFAAEQRLDELTAELEVLAARQLRLQAELAELDTRVSQSSLHAPYAGQVARRLVDTGAVINAGQTVLQLLELGHEQADVGIPASFASQLALGSEVLVRQGQAELPATVMAIGHSVDAVTHTINVRLALPAGYRGMDGQLVYLPLPERRQQAGFWVASAALKTGVRGLWTVLVLVPDAASGQFSLQARTVEVLAMSGERVFIHGAIEEGEQIVSSGSHRYAVGQVVRVGVAG